MVKECDTTRVPGRMARIVGRSFMLSAGSRYSVITVAWLKSVAKMSPWRMVALPGPTPATPAACALPLACFAMSGLYSMPVARAPNFFAAAIAILPSPAPRSTAESFGVDLRHGAACARPRRRASAPRSRPCRPGRPAARNFGCGGGAAKATAARRASGDARVIEGSGRMKWPRNVAERPAGR